MTCSNTKARAHHEFSFALSHGSTCFAVHSHPDVQSDRLAHPKGEMHHKGTLCMRAISTTNAANLASRMCSMQLTKCLRATEPSRVVQLSPYPELKFSHIYPHAGDCERGTQWNRSVNERGSTAVNLPVEQRCNDMIATMVTATEIFHHYV